MTSFPDQLSAVRQSQWETQLELFRRLGSSALDNTEQLIALNIRTSRASLEHATGTVRQLLEASDPRDLLAVGSNAQGQWHQMFAYGRELLGIATGMRGTWSTMPSTLPFVPALPGLPAPAAVPAAVLRLIPAPTADVPATPSLAAEQLAIASADATTIASELGAAALDIGTAVVQSSLDGDAEVAPAAEPPVAMAPPVIEFSTAPATTDAVHEAPAAEAAAEEPAAEPVITPAEAALAFADAASDTAIADAVPPLDVTPLVKALNEVAPKPAGVEHPIVSIVSTVPLEAAAGAIELPAVEPVEHTAPPPQPALQGKPPRVSRKK